MGVNWTLFFLSNSKIKKNLIHCIRNVHQLASHNFVILLFLFLSPAPVWLALPVVLFGYYGSTIYERLDLYTNSAGFYNLFLFALFGYYGSMIHYFWGHTVNTGTAMIWIHYFQRVPAGTLWKWWTHYLGYVFVRNKEMDPWFPKSSSRHSLEMMDPLLRLCICQK